MRTKLVVGNWKMNLTNPQAAAAIESLSKLVDSRQDVDAAICPPYTSIGTVRNLLRTSHVKVGAQNVFWKDSGAFTGFISAPMLLELGCAYCIVGHSETRGRFGKLEVPESTLGFFAETDETVNLKMRSLLFHGINPILCVGESLEEREAGITEQVIRKQLEGALAGFDAAELYFSVIAYEPVWAIGTGKTCDTAEAERICAFIRSTVADLFDQDLSDLMRVLYGGSVKSSNSRELFHQPNIDGGLVGGASLDPAEFSRIITSA